MDRFGEAMGAQGLLAREWPALAVAMILAEAGCALVLDLDELPTEPQAPVVDAEGE